ncbi:deoxycytidyl transferase [Geranomyces variabilis]|uniref:DNA repair protein REV1 n=1 Tax=Geranomyces variabilis TaxID=109894 RepID=A0AAD5TBD9_9FUNG|nr:deoxycytidyl transferase [Geranomyces variabilis]
MAFPGGIGEYMAVKRQKLFDQGHAFAAAGSESTALAGITLYFNGYTGTSLSYLDFKELVLVHGALVRDKLEGDVTHLIATQMTSKKQKEILKPIVRPEWLTDSIAQGKLLPWRQYRLFTDVEASQRTFGGLAAVDGAASYTRPRGESETSSPNPPPPLHPPPPPPPPFPPGDADLPEAEEGDEAVEVPDEAVVQDDASQQRKLNMQSAWVRANICTAPNFLQRYFASSRLHHLTTWKNSLRDFVAVESARLGKRKGRHHHAAGGGARIIMHVDMDCFFASVAVRDRPDLRDRPVAVAHSAGTAANRSTSEIASCNYAARKYGVKNGMSMGKARDRCRDLLVMPYEFEKYDECSKALYTILLSHADDVQAVSIDEGYIDASSSITAAGAGQEIELAQKIRKEIFAATGCTASIGIGPNMLVARMATNRAKPDGAHLVTAGTEPEFMALQRISDLPGVGFVLSEKLEQKHIETCEQLCAVSLSVLQRDYGEKTGSMLHRACRGMDARELENKPRQSVGAEINWGVRFETQEQVEKFLLDLTEEVVKRMKAISVKGRQVTVKVKRRRYEGEPAKVLGCGDCDNLSKSSALSGASDAVDLIFREAYRMLREQRVDPDFIRGIGLHMGKLEGGPVAQAAMETGQKTLNFGFERPAADQVGQEAREQSGAIVVNLAPPQAPRPNGGASSLYDRYGIRIEEIDWDVLAQLPPEMQAEIRPHLEARATQIQHADSRVDERPPPPPPAAADIPPAPPQGSWSPRLKAPPVQFKLPTASQVDPEVFKALPLDMQREIEAALKQATLPHPAARLPLKRQRIGGGAGGSKTSKVSPRSKKAKMISPSKGQPRLDQLVPGPSAAIDKLASLIPSEAAAAATRQHDKMPDPAARRPALGTLTDANEIRAMLNAWIEAQREHGPDPVDVEAVSGYLVALVEEMELEQVDVLLRWFMDRVGVEPHDGKGKGRGVWAEVCHRLLDTANTAVQKRHGARLRLDAR